MVENHDLLHVEQGKYFRKQDEKVSNGLALVVILTMISLVSLCSFFAQYSENAALKKDRDKFKDAYYREHATSESKDSIILNLSKQ